MNTIVKNILLLGLLFITACSDESKQEDLFEKEDSSNFSRQTSEEQRLVAPTNLFQSIQQEDFQSFMKYLNSEGSFLFNQKNEDGDTPLSLAMRLRQLDMVNALIPKASPGDLRVKLKDGRSYLSLAVEYDLLEVFDSIVKFYREKEANLDFLIFSFLDFKDDFGRRSAFYARSYSMIERLEVAWFQSNNGSIQNYFHRFYYTRDNEGNTFLHLAALNQNTQVIQWYVEHHCERESEAYFQRIGNFFRRMGDTLADWEYFPSRRRFINFQNDEGNTPLHLAASAGRVKSINELTACYQTDPTILNDGDRIAITELLKNIDYNQDVVSRDYKESFFYLYGLLDPTWSRVDMAFAYDSYGFGVSLGAGNSYLIYMKKQDNQTDMTPVHYAALIRDPYFWDILEPYHEIRERNAEGFTPVQLRLDENE